jgi:hypothetical protein
VGRIVNNLQIIIFNSLDINNIRKMGIMSDNLISLDIAVSSKIVHFDLFSLETIGEFDALR